VDTLVGASLDVRCDALDSAFLSEFGREFGEERARSIIRDWCNEEAHAVEQRLFRFGASGTLVSAEVDTERGSVRVTNTEGRSLALAAPADTAQQVAAMLHNGPARYHVASSGSAGSLAAVWVWSRSRSRCFVVSAVADADAETPAR